MQPPLLCTRNSYTRGFVKGQGSPGPLQTARHGGKTLPPSRSLPTLRVPKPTCVVAVVMRITEHCISFVHGATRVVAQLRARVRVTPASLHTLSSSRLVFVIWVVFLVLDTEPLSLLHKRTLLIFTQQPAENTEGSMAIELQGCQGPRQYLHIHCFRRWP